MPTPGEHKTVQSRILGYAEAIGWTFVSREEAEQRRGFDPEVPPADRAKNRSLFVDDLLDAKLREFNPRYAEAEGALLGQFRHLHTDIYGNREFVEQLRNRGKFSNSGIDRRHPQPKHTHEAFWKTSHEQHLDRG
jgi:type I restriction enzyme R subunit